MIKTITFWPLIPILFLFFKFAAAQGDVFEFIPSGGKSLLLQVLQNDIPHKEILPIVSAKKTQEEWRKYLRRKSETIAALADITETQLDTLATYLSFNMPLPKDVLAKDINSIEWSKVLPPDGRQLALNNCQFCHIITVVVTQGKEATGWIGLLGTPSHVVVEISEQEKETLSHYLAINMPVPEEDIPEELRAGGASY